MRGVVGLLAVLLTASGIAPCAAAQRPAPPRIRAVVFSGEHLLHRIAITDTVVVAELLSSVRDPMTDPSRSLAYRPYIDVALFQANPLSAAMPLQRVPVADADGHARYYPAYGDEAAFWVFEDDAHEPHPVRYVLQTGLDLLQRHGIPVRLRPGE